VTIPECNGNTSAPTSSRRDRSEPRAAAVTTDLKRTAQFEHTVVVTKTGAEVLTSPLFGN
jgi:methionine aminopeptidase